MKQTTKGKLMVIDDEVDIATVVSIALEHRGYQCSAVSRPEDALARIREEHPDIVVLDIMMPGVQGFEICRRIRKDRELYKTPILICTAMGHDPEIVYGLEQGADAYITKPFTPDALVEKIELMLQLKQDIDRLNPLTALPGSEAIKREIDHRIARGAFFAVCYVDVEGISSYRDLHGEEQKQFVIKETAALLGKIAAELNIREFFLGHLGAEHFIAITHIADHEPYSQKALEDFKHLLELFHDKKELAQGYMLARSPLGEAKKCSLLRMSIGVVHNKQRSFDSANHVFQVLAQVKHKAEGTGQAIVFVDRRKSDRT